MPVDAAAGCAVHVIAPITSRQSPGRFFLHQLACFGIPVVKVVPSYPHSLSTGPVFCFALNTQPLSDYLCRDYHDG